MTRLTRTVLALILNQLTPGRLLCENYVARRMALVASLLITSSSYAQVGIYTWRNDIGRTGQNRNESILSPSNVNASTFGKLFSLPVDGYVYAQPLYVPQLEVPGRGIHNVVFVATQHDTIYAFDADTNGGDNATPLWQASFLDPIHGAVAGSSPETPSNVGSEDINPEIGITSTPVIEPITSTLYAVGKTVENGVVVQRIHALDLATGQEKSGSPVTINASVPGTGNGSTNGVLTFSSRWALNRPSLLLLNGIVYIGFSAHGDNGPWHGWILGYNARTLQQTGAFCASPNGTGSGFWMSGAGLAADVIDAEHKPFGRMFVATGNGSFNAAPPYNPTQNFGDDQLALDLTNGSPTVGDSFTPMNQQALDATDTDLGSGGVLILPDQATGGHTHLLVQAGKAGTIYLVDRDNMGGFNSTFNDVVQEISGQTTGFWSTPAYFNGNIYVNGSGDHLKTFSLSNGTLSLSPTAVAPEALAYPGASPSISSNGTANGIVWTIDSSDYIHRGPAVLYAHSAENVSNTLYSSKQNSTRDQAGAAVKYSVPTVANGKVYVGTETDVTIFGLLNGKTQAATPSLSPGSGQFLQSLTVSITDITPGTSIYYTTDGSTPTSASTLYRGSIALNSTTTINAIATSNGLIQSGIASATYLLSSQASQPQFSTAGGSYSSVQTITLTDSTPNSIIYYTMDGSPPTSSSAVYASPLTIANSTTIKAYARASGFTDSAVVTSSYDIESLGASVNFGNGFSGALSASTPMIFNGSTDLDDSRLQLTNGGLYQAGSAWYGVPMDIRSFITDFTFQLSNPQANGITFAIQNSSPNAIGGYGVGLGYGQSSGATIGYGEANVSGIPNSAALKFDLWNNTGEDNSTGLFFNGPASLTPSLDLTGSGISLHSGDAISVHLAYDGTLLTMNMTDQVTGALFYASWVVNLPQMVGSANAYIGFTGGTGVGSASQKITTWTFVSTGSTQSAALPVISPVGGTYVSPQTITLSDATPQSTIYYTTDGTIPTIASQKYTVPFPLEGKMIVNAIASAHGFANSVVANSSLVAISPISVTPQPISIDFNGNEQPMSPIEAAGVVPERNWNNAVGPVQSSPLQLRDSAGGQTNASVTWQAAGIWDLPIPTASNDNHMMKGYLDTTNTSSTTISISGLAPNATGYDIYIYVDGDNLNESRTGQYTISGRTATTTMISATDDASVNFSGLYNAASNGPGNYLKFFASGTEFVITGVPLSSNGSYLRAPINGLQIIPEPPASTPDFKLAITPGNVTLAGKASASVTVAAALDGNLSSAINLSASGLPTGMNASFAPATLSTSTPISTLLLSSSTNVVPGTYSITITGTSGQLSHNTTFSLTVTSPPPDFTLTTSSSSVTVTDGQKIALDLVVTGLNNFADTVTLSVSGLTAVTNATLSPTSISGGSGSTMLSLAVFKAAPGVYPITILATSGSLTHTLSIALTVASSPGDFRVKATPDFQVISSSGSGAYQIGVWPLNGFTGNVVFQVSGLPSGISFVSSAVNVTGGVARSVVQLANNAVQPGNYSFTLSATSGSITHTQRLFVEVTQ